MVLELRRHLKVALKTLARTRRGAAFRQILPRAEREAWARESPAGRADRARFVISPCLPKLRALPPPLRKTSPLDLSKLPRCEKLPTPAPAHCERRFASQPLLLVPAASLPSLSDQALGSSLPLQRRSKPVVDDGASTSGDGSALAAPRYDRARSSANYPGGIRECRETLEGKLPGSHQRRRQRLKG